MPRGQLAPIHRSVNSVRLPLPPDDKFVVWYLKAFLVDNDDSAEQCLLGNSNDKGVDAMHIDDNARIVFLVQGKYHQKATPEERSKVIELASLGQMLCSKSAKSVDQLILTAHPRLAGVLPTIRERVRQRGYRLHLKFITTGSVSKNTAADARELLRGSANVDLEPVGHTQLIHLWQDYVQGAAPPIPLVRLKIRDKEFFSVIDKATRLQSHLASVEASSLSKLYADHGVRIFARNIRGYLSGRPGKRKAASRDAKDVNSQIANSLRTEPQYFWYYNNGVTMVADSAVATTTHVDVTNAQIINGQQTTRVIADTALKGSPAVLLKVIVIPRQTKADQQRYRSLVNEIVKATNWQNKIGLADLATNDDEQIRLERSFVERGYNYVRRRQSSYETLRLLRKQKRPRVSKELLAQATAACTLDPVTAQAKDRLFDSVHYPKVFHSSRSVDEYLTFYWLATCAFGVGTRVNAPRSRYAKWLVLNRLWHFLQPELSRAAFRQSLVDLAIHDRSMRDELRALADIADAIYRVASDAFDASARKERDLELPTFFKRHASVQAWDRQFRSVSNTRSRRMLVKKRKKFLESLLMTEAAN